MPVPPQRSASWNPMRDVVGRVREIAGHSAGGSLTDEARRTLPSTTGRRWQSSGAIGLGQSETFHTSQSLWVSGPIALTAGSVRVVAVNVRATGLTPGIVGTLVAGVNVLATAPANASGVWVQTIAWIAQSGLVVGVEWPSAESGTLVATILDAG